MKEGIKKDNAGIAALLSVVIIGVIALLLAKNSAFIGLADLDMANNSILSGIALSNAESCLEESLRQIQFDKNFESPGWSLTLEEGTCVAKVSKEDDLYIITSEGRMLSYLKIVEVQAYLDNGGLTISSWRKK